MTESNKWKDGGEICRFFSISNEGGRELKRWISKSNGWPGWRQRRNGLINAWQEKWEEREEVPFVPDWDLVAY